MSTRPAPLDAVSSAARAATEAAHADAEMARLRSATNQNLHSFSSPRPQDLPDTGMFLGTMVYASSQLGPAVYLPSETLARHPHILVSGASGSGKSWHMMHIARQVIAHQPTSSPGVAPRATRGVAYHSFNFGATGGKGLAFRSGKR